MDDTLDHQTLAKFTSIENMHSFSTLTPDVLLSDGAKYVADRGGAYWLMDKIALHQVINDEYHIEEFQHWTLWVDNAFMGKLECEDGNENIIFREFIDYVYFPLRVLDLYATKWGKKTLIMLPGEYGD